MDFRGTTLSRWTLSYFAVALAFLLGALALLALGVGYPSAAPRAPQTLIVVHCVTIGWLSLLMCGALFQFVPVLVAKPIYSNALPLPALILIVAGLVALIAGFMQLAGILPWTSRCFAAAGILLASGFAIVLWTLGRTLAGGWPPNLAARFVIAGLCSVAATVTFGVIFTLGYGGYIGSSSLTKLRMHGLPLHIIAGLGGWLTFTAMGVSHRLLAMFMLAPEPDGASTRWTLRLGALALAAVIGIGAAAVAMAGGLDAVLLVAGVLGIGSLALYAHDIRTLYRRRVRRVIELNSRMAAVALTHLAVAVLGTIACAATGSIGRFSGVLVFLVCFGWLTGLGLAKLYKIVAFVTWLECYGPVLGKAPTPRVQDLVVERRGERWFWLYFGAVDLATVCLLAGLPLAFRIAAVLMWVATAGIALELVRTRRLANVKEALRLPAGAHRPRLLLTFVAH